jgi:general secretion pathway protein A
MYLQHFALHKYPFSLTPDPSFLYLTTAHREALAGLLFAVTCRKGFLVLTGDAGTGKTTLLRTMLARTPPASTIFSFVVHTTLTSAEFLESTLLDFGITNIPDSKAQRLRLFRDFLVRSAEAGKTPVLVVDEAQKLSPELLEEIRLLTNAETAEQKLLQIILAGQDELVPVLARDDMRQLRQRIAVRVRIGPLSNKDVVQYMRTRWSRAGGADALPFDADAVLAITRYSRGIPRVINSIADAALLKAFSANRKVIHEGDIQAVAQWLELSVSSPMENAPASPKTLLTMPVRPSAQDVQSTPRLIRRPLDEEPACRPPALKRWAARFGVGGG